MVSRHSTFVLPLAQFLLGILRLLFPAFWLQRLGLFPYWVVDLWVLSWTLLAGASYVASFSVLGDDFQIAILIGGILRIAEISIFHLSALLTFSVAGGGLRSHRRTIVLLLLNYCEIVLWFAAFYSLLGSANDIVVHAPVFVSPLRESVSLMVANSTGALDLRDSVLGWTTVTAQSAIGLFMTTIVAARIISLLPKPSSFDPAEDESAERRH
jgi:hypothetical protein